VFGKTGSGAGEMVTAGLTEEAPVLAALIRKVFHVEEEEIAHGEWVVRFRGQDGTIEQLGVYAGEKKDALECGKTWLALKFQHIDAYPTGYLELRKRSGVHRESD